MLLTFDAIIYGGISSIFISWKSSLHCMVMKSPARGDFTMPENQIKQGWRCQKYEFLLWIYLHMNRFLLVEFTKLSFQRIVMHSFKIFLGNDWAPTEFLACLHYLCPHRESHLVHSLSSYLVEGHSHHGLELLWCGWLHCPKSAQ